MPGLFSKKHLLRLQVAMIARETRHGFCSRSEQDLKGRKPVSPGNFFLKIVTVMKDAPLCNSLLELPGYVD
jgi:hypothetical protein